MSNPVDAFFGNPLFANAMRMWQAIAQGSLLTYNEPILPGWTINIDSDNSSSPGTERDVLRMASYGTQLGVLNDAVARLIALAPEGEQASFDEFTTLKQRIDQVKRPDLGRRVRRVTAELAALKASDPTEFEKLSAPLRTVL